MDICVIGGKEYEVIIESLTESFSKLYSEDTGRTMGVGLKMNLSCLGTFFSHKITFLCKPGYEPDFDELYNLAAQPTNDGIPVKIVHGQSAIEYEAYISSGERALKRVDKQSGVVYWDAFTAELTPMEANLIL